MRKKSHEYMRTVGLIVLRQWRDEDLEPFAAMNADAEVMEFFSKPLSKAESAEFFMLIRTRIEFCVSECLILKSKCDTFRSTPDLLLEQLVDA